MRFADDIDGLARGDEQELSKLVERLDTTSAANGIEINVETTKLMASTEVEKIQPLRLDVKEGNVVISNLWA